MEDEGGIGSSFFLSTNFGSGQLFEIKPFQSLKLC
jgi:hypothetical protein